MTLLDLFLISVLIGLVAWKAIFTGASIATLSDKYGVYRRAYPKFKKADFTKSGSLVKGSKDFIYFPEDGDFKLGKNRYIHNNCVTSGDPYAKYYLELYTEHMRQNTDHVL